MIIKPPEHYQAMSPSIFLAGSIEQGKADDWQSIVAKEIDSDAVAVYNPRRDNWTELDEHNLEFQIKWEQKYLAWSNIHFFYFAENTSSVVSMLELGQSLESYAVACGPLNDLIIVVHPNYFRRKNIEITSKLYGIDIYSTLDEGIQELKRIIL